MAEGSFADQFKIRPAPRKTKTGRLAQKRKKIRVAIDLHTCAEGDLCVYVVGPDDERLSKVGVSAQPYRRLADLAEEVKLDLRMCYFAQMTKEQARLVERTFLSECKKNGTRVDGEWVSVPRAELTAHLRRIMRWNGIIPTKEVGDTTEERDGDDPDGIKTYVCNDAFMLGITPRKRRNG